MAEHQPREHAVLCSRCLKRRTWNLSGYCDECQDLETCSWCTTEVEDRTLTEMPDGARICRVCLKEAGY